MSESITIYTDTDEEIEVTADYSPADNCTRFEYGAPMDPSYPAYWEITGATLNGEEYELTKDQEQEAEEAFSELEQD